MDAAVAGLLGAVVGGAMTAGSTLLLESWKRAEDLRRLSAASERETRQARRIIADEINEALFAVDQTLATGLWWPAPSYMLPTARWNTYGPGLAATEMSDENWEWVFLAYQALREANSRLAAEPHDSPSLVDQSDREFLLGVRQSLEDGLRALRASQVPGRGVGVSAVISSVPAVGAPAAASSATSSFDPKEREPPDRLS